MTTPFLTTFSERVLARLMTDRLITIDEAAVDRVVLFVANWLGSREPGSSLISSLEAALLACTEVDEVFADLDDLKSVVDDLG